MRVLVLALSFLFLSSLTVNAAFNRTTLSVIIDVKKNGTAHIVEVIGLFMDSNDSIRKYEISMSNVGTTIDRWRNLTGVEDIRLHTDAQHALPANIQVLPQRRTECNTIEGTCRATIRIEYDTLKPIFYTNRTKPRTVNFTLKKEVLSFENSPTGAIVLPEFTNLTIRLPEGANILAVSPKPDNIPQGKEPPYRDVRELSWATQSSKTTVGLELSFGLIEPIDVEVSEFFADIESAIRHFVSAYWYVVVGILLLSVSYYLYRYRRMSILG
ncbi:MAG: hypothetical protein QXP42_04085 [Candidatus Micrarchaeia archaeon]